MQKKLIALAVASLLAAPVMAQSNVTVYGVADVYMKNTWGDGKRVTGVDSGGENGSRLGFRGTEDLGNGLKAVFDFQFGTIALETGGGLTGTRTAFAGLSGNFGTLVAGRIQPAGYFQSYYFDPAMAHFFSPYQRLTKGIAARGVGASINTGWNPASRQNNAINYRSPTFGGFKANLTYGFGEQDSSPRQGFASVGLEYQNGPLRAGYVFQELSNIGGTSDDQREHFIGASYNFGMVTVLGSWQNARVKGSAFSTETDKVWNVGAKVMVGPATHLMLGYVKANVDASGGDGKGYTLGIMHSLSKRTHLYGGYGRVKNGKDTSRFNWREDFAIDNGSSVSTFGLGISHLF